MIVENTSELKERIERLKREKNAVILAHYYTRPEVQAVADFRGVDFFQFFYAGDNLDHSQWQPRSLSGHVRLDDKSKIALLAFELAAKL
mgnify:CR=1 FL=1